MKIFISWSGEYSKGVALALKEWLPMIFNPIDVFVSSESIRKGKRWPQEIAKELETTNFGIACLTHDNLAAPWLLFETGALSKLPESSVSTLLLGGLATSDIGTSPLSHFQHTVFEKEDVLKLVKAINEAQVQGKRDVISLEKIFGKFWGDLEVSVEAAGNKGTKPPEPKRTIEDMVRELLDVTNTIARNLSQPRFPIESLEQSIDATILSNSKAEVDLWSEYRGALLAVDPSVLMKYFTDAYAARLESNILKIFFSSDKAHSIIGRSKSSFTELMRGMAHKLGRRVPDEVEFIFPHSGQPPLRFKRVAKVGRA